MKRATVCFPITNTEILLGKKKLRFGTGKWNGFGGKIHENETPERAAVRELHEECGLSADETSLEKVGVLLFHFNGIATFLVHAYLVREWTGIPKETDEMAPQWHSLKHIPYDNMWQADQLWLNEVLSGNKVAAHVHFTTDGEPGKDQEVFDRIEEDDSLWTEN